MESNELPLELVAEEERSVTRVLSDLKEGDQEAAEQIWERFFHRVCGLARKKLGDARKRVADEEDIAQSAMHALYDGIQKDRFRKLENRDDLWQLLVMLTSRKAALVWRKQTRRKESGESVFAGGDDTVAGGIARVVDQTPNDAYVDQLCDACDDLVSKLDPKLQQVAAYKLQGYTNEEIGDLMERSVKSVERYLKMIRYEWSKE